MIILGLESSCDETAAAVVRDGFQVLSNVVSSQVDMHAAYGGVVPELAAREHLRNLEPVVSKALQKSGVAAGDLDGIAVTCRPGLITSLLVGVNYAKGMALASGIPLLGIDHFTAHIYSCFLEKPETLQSSRNFPLLALVVSGGHTSLILLQANGEIRIVGQTIDDAAGEAFDKGAKLLDLGYPGGPAIEAAGRSGNSRKHHFPRGLTGGGGKPIRAVDRFNFSFSGVKTALFYEVGKGKTTNSVEQADLAASYQAAIVDVLVRKTMAAAEYYTVPKVLLCGGVACNQKLRHDLGKKLESAGKDLLTPSPSYCTDNAAMVAGLAWHELRHGRTANLELDAQARLPVQMEPASFAPAFGSR